MKLVWFANVILAKKMVFFWLYHCDSSEHQHTILQACANYIKLQVSGK